MIQRKPSNRVKSANKSSNISHQLNNFKLTNVDVAATPIVTASAWSIHDANNGDLLWEKKGDEAREMASLTKMMTLLVTNTLCHKYKENPEKLVFGVNRVAALINGTHSCLKEGDQICVKDLYYALMLPSGNDAALCLAYGMGALLIKRKRMKSTNGIPLSPLKEFIKEMNKVAQKLGLKNTNFANPHGLSEKGNKSTAAELGRIAYIALQVPIIKEVVNTQTYSTEVTDVRGNVRKMTWNNTNKLLAKGFEGMKTGITPNAGPCLSSLLRIGDDAVIITVLNCKSLDHRFSESEKLALWALSSLRTVKEKFCEFAEDAAEPIKINNRIIANLCKQL